MIPRELNGCYYKGNKFTAKRPAAIQMNMTALQKLNFLFKEYLTIKCKIGFNIE